jgi:hypothetical protein
MSFSEIDFIELPYPVQSQVQTLQQTIIFDDIGGNFLDSDFLKNPIFRLQVLRPQQFKIKVELDRSAYVMLYLVKDINQGNFHQSEDCLSLPFVNFLDAVNPKFYFQGISCLCVELEVGNYFVVVSIQSITKKILETPQNFCFEVSSTPNLDFVYLPGQIYKKNKPNPHFDNTEDSFILSRSITN